MRRSLAPSSLAQKRTDNMNNVVSVPEPLFPRFNDNKRSTRSSDSNTDDNNSLNNLITIERVSMFDFLSIPDHLKRKFVVPRGVTVTEESLVLRKKKTLGAPKVFNEIRPGGYMAPFQRLDTSQGVEEAEELEGEDENGSNLPPYERLVLWMDDEDCDNKIEVVPSLASKLRPHQREGVQFLFECTMGLRGFDGQGCILADDMGLGKTLMSITLLWTLLNQGMTPGKSAVHKIMVVCPTSLVGNWDNELRKWLHGKCPTFPVKSDPKKVIRNFVQCKSKAVLIVSYETQRRYVKMFKPSITTGNADVVDMIICDEAHKLKNAESGLAKALDSIPARKRILLSGTPMQNELTEFFNMVNFCNPMVLGTSADFRKKYERPILASREIDASDKEVNEAARLQKELSTIVNEFILKRGNILNARHLPPKLTQIVCCRLTPLQDQLYDYLTNSKELRHARDGTQQNTLNSIRYMMNICSHPRQILDSYQAKEKECMKTSSIYNDDVFDDFDTNSKSKNKVKGKKGKKGESVINEELEGLAKLILEDKDFMNGCGSCSNSNSNRSLVKSSTRGSINTNTNSSSSMGKLGSSIDPEQSGKMYVLYRLMQSLQSMMEGDRIVVVSNYTQTLDCIGNMCTANNWPVLRLDGSTNLNKRTKLVDQFNDPGSGAFVFLLSSKAGGCGINLIGGNRLVLFDPDWNPANDKQAAGRIWREGQKKRCFIYRFASTSTVEEKIIQRQLSKEGLQQVVENKDQTNAFSTEELKSLFMRRKDTVSDTHDALRCKRCKSVKAYEIRSKNLSEWQKNECVEFLEDFISSVKDKLMSNGYIPCDGPTVTSDGDGDDKDDSANNDDNHSNSKVYFPLPVVLSNLTTNRYPTLPLFSRALRQSVLELDHSLEAVYLDRTTTTITIANEDGTTSTTTTTNSNSDDVMKLHFMSDFLSRWSDIVPMLHSGSNNNSISGSKGDSDSLTHQKEGVDSENNTNDEVATQIGCPEEDALNEWSHHCSVHSTDDEALKRAVGDDTAVSFVFGYEVDWDLLQLRQEAKKDEEEARKQQAKLDLEELNARRAEKKQIQKQKQKEKEMELAKAQEEEKDELLQQQPQPHPYPQQSPEEKIQDENQEDDDEMIIEEENDAGHDETCIQPEDSDKAIDVNTGNVDRVMNGDEDGAAGRIKKEKKGKKRKKDRRDKERGDRKSKKDKERSRERHKIGDAIKGDSLAAISAPTSALPSSSNSDSIKKKRKIVDDSDSDDDGNVIIDVASKGMIKKTLNDGAMDLCDSDVDYDAINATTDCNSRDTAHHKGINYGSDDEDGDDATETESIQDEKLQVNKIHSSKKKHIDSNSNNSNKNKSSRVIKEKEKENYPQSAVSLVAEAEKEAVVANTTYKPIMNNAFDDMVPAQVRRSNSHKDIGSGSKNIEPHSSTSISANMSYSNQSLSTSSVAVSSYDPLIKWQCPGCTFRNIGSDTICSMCESKRPRERRHHSSRSSKSSTKV